MRAKITEYLDIDLEREQWVCNRCDKEIAPAAESYKYGCLVYERDPREIHRPLLEGPYSFAPDIDYCRIIEFYCPHCGTMMENEYLPPGHPITVDIELDLAKLKAKENLACDKRSARRQDKGV